MRMTKISLTLLALFLVSPLVRAEASAPAAENSAYPLTTCLVSGEELGSMGDAYVHNYKEEGKLDREVRLCCKGCLKKFSKDPAKYIGILDASAKTAGALSVHAH